jgi:molybdate transport system ATP-binding protein
VAASVYPWELGLQPASPAPPAGSAQNRLPATVTTTTVLGNRVRVALDGPPPLAAEVTAAAAEQLGLRPGTRVNVAWKATATRLTPR